MVFIVLSNHLYVTLKNNKQCISTTIDDYTAFISFIKQLYNTITENAQDIARNLLKNAPVENRVDNDEQL